MGLFGPKKELINFVFIRNGEIMLARMRNNDSLVIPAIELDNPSLGNTVMQIGAIYLTINIDLFVELGSFMHNGYKQYFVLPLKYHFFKNKDIYFGYNNLDMYDIDKYVYNLDNINEDDDRTFALRLFREIMNNKLVYEVKKSSKVYDIKIKDYGKCTYNGVVFNQEARYYEKK